METAIKIFSNPLGNIRVVTERDGDPMFLANDLTNALGYANPRDAVNRHCDTEDVVKHDTPTESGIQLMTYVNESGMYSLILKSKLPQAKQFKRWVTSEVLPAIRKHGGYLTQQKIEEAILNPDTLIQLATTLKEEQAARRLAESKAQHLEEVAREQAPKVLFAQAVETSSMSCLIGELAKILKQNGIDMGQNKLFRWLREKGYLCSVGERYNQPTQKAMDLDLFEIKKTTINKPDGTVLVTTTTKCTGKGQIYFTNKFLSTNN